MKLKTNNDVMAELMANKKNRSKLDKIRSQVEGITKRSVWNDVVYKDGKLIGLLRTIGFEYKHRKELLNLFSDPDFMEDLVGMFLDAYGHPTFIDKNEMKAVPAKPMDIERVKMCLEVAGEVVGYKPYLEDITKERVANNYEYQADRVQATLDALS